MSTPTADGHSDAGLGSWVDTDGRSDVTSWAEVAIVIAIVIVIVIAIVSPFL